MKEEEHHPEPRDCKFCNAVNDPDTEECIECDMNLDLEPVICIKCGYPNQPFDLQCYQCDQSIFLQNNNITLEERILYFLRKNVNDTTLTLGKLATALGMEDKKSNLSYHLSGLASNKVGLITKTEITGRAPTYSLNQSVMDDTKRAIVKFLQTDYDYHSIDEIKPIVIDEGSTNDILVDDINMKSLETILDKMVKELEIQSTPFTDSETGEKTMKWQIPFWKLPKSVCHYCRKDFEDNQLVISQIMNQEDFEVTDHFPIHATCRSKANATGNPAGWDNSYVCCDYCGLELSAQDLQLFIPYETSKAQTELTEYQKIKNQAVAKVLNSAIETIFDDPYSKIFSNINAAHDILDPTSQEVKGYGGSFRPQSYSYFVRKNGKQYHPYCAKQVEK